MCFFFKPAKDIQLLEKRFELEVADHLVGDFFDSPTEIYNGFAHPFLPIITNINRGRIRFFQWGLLPQWAKEKSFQKNTLNARLETLNEKPSFKENLQNRCLVPAKGFVEWQWQDPKGKEKIKYFIEIEGSPIIAFAGLWSEWVDKSTGEIIPTFTIITTEANEFMAEIHNTKKRMPVILTPESENEWLEKGIITMWNEKLTAHAI
ncbi:MAG: SOS response-associated peptidase [Porphyromonadaceae bacterium]|jgi:putative SOS response-associated peptidase YedK|nr:SOS response-associated peptidase [Porphyromonadaceae bacterium]